MCVNHLRTDANRQLEPSFINQYVVGGLTPLKIISQSTNQPKHGEKSRKITIKPPTRYNSIVRVTQLHNHHDSSGSITSIDSSMLMPVVPRSQLPPTFCQSAFKPRGRPRQTPPDPPQSADLPSYPSSDGLRFSFFTAQQPFPNEKSAVGRLFGCNPWHDNSSGH